MQSYIHTKYAIHPREAFHHQVTHMPTNLEQWWMSPQHSWRERTSAFDSEKDGTPDVSLAKPVIERAFDKTPRDCLQRKAFGRRKRYLRRGTYSKEKKGISTFICILIGRPAYSGSTINPDRLLAAAVDTTIVKYWCWLLWLLWSV